MDHKFLHFDILHTTSIDNHIFLWQHYQLTVQVLKHKRLQKKTKIPLLMLWIEHSIAHRSKREHKKDSNSLFINLSILVLLCGSVGHDSFITVQCSVENKTAGDSLLRLNINQPNWLLQIAGATVKMEDREKLQQSLKPLSWQRSHPWQGSGW